MVIVEIEAIQSLSDDAHDSLDGFFEFGIARARVTVGRFVESRTRQHDSAPRSTDSGHGFVARDANGSFGQGIAKFFAASQAQQPEQVLPTLDMAIQSGLLHAKLGRNLG